MAVIFERSVDTNSTIDVLRGVNDEISYVDLARRAGLSVPRLKSVLTTARRRLCNDEGILFDTIRGEGLRLMNDHDKVMEPQATKRRIARTAHRGLKHLSTIVDFGSLSKVDQHAGTLHRTSLNAIRQFALVKPGEPTQKTETAPLPNVASLINLKKNG